MAFPNVGLERLTGRVVDEGKSECVSPTFRNAFGKGRFLVVSGPFYFCGLEVSTNQLLMKSFELDTVNDVNRIDDILILT